MNLTIFKTRTKYHSHNLFPELSNSSSKNLLRHHSWMRHNLTFRAPSPSHPLPRNCREISQSRRKLKSSTRTTKRWRTYWVDTRKQPSNPSRELKASLALSVWSLSLAAVSRHVATHSATNASVSASLERRNAHRAVRTSERRCSSNLWWSITPSKWLCRPRKKAETLKCSNSGKSAWRSIKSGSIATESLQCKQVRN